MFSGPDEDYGALELGCDIIDMSLEEYQNKKQIFMEKLMLNSEEIAAIERDTIGQQDNDQWRIQRKSRLTASNFGKVCKLRPTTSRANTVKYILYDIFQENSATRYLFDYITKCILFYFNFKYLKKKMMYRYGIENEPIARNAVQEKLKIEIKSAGLFIHKFLPYLAASPDGLINNDSIIEIKCPPSIKEFTPEEAVQNGKLKYMVNCKGKLILKKTDNYYYQVQGQLNITEKKFCYFVVWTPKGTYIITIYVLYIMYLFNIF